MNPLTLPDWFPDRLDPDSRSIRMVPTTRAILSDSAFLDGRTPISPPGAAGVVLPLPDLPSAPLRWLFHESFCGSTLLSRLVAAAGHAFVLREPQILVDLANRPDPRAIATVRGLLARRWQTDEPIVVKPSNWVNIALPHLWSSGDRGLVVTIAVDAFLVAVVRGGRDRIAYTLRLYEAFVRAFPGLSATVSRANPPNGEPLAIAIGLVAALHWMQRRVLDRFGPPARLDFPSFVADPPAALAIAAEALDIDIARTDMSRHLAIHAKSRDRPIDRAAEDRASDAVLHHHGDAITDALAFHARLDGMDGDLPTAKGIE